MGLEPTTLCLRGRCSNQLSYGPVVRPERLELPTLRFEAARSIQLSYGRVTEVIIAVFLPFVDMFDVGGNLNRLTHSLQFLPRVF